MVQNLRDLETSSSISSGKLHNAKIKLINEAIRELKQLVVHHVFPDEQEEILFFKHVKPKFTCLLIYHSQLALLELKKPTGTRKDIRKHYEKELLLIRVFFESHLPFYQYMRSEATYLDSKLFVRGASFDLPFHHASIAMDTDTRFTTHYDYLAGHILANELLRDHLIKCLSNLELGQLTGDGQGLRKELTWTGSKVHLIELAYALYESGQVNNGTIGVVEIATQLEEFFQVKLGNVYRTFQEVRQRKKDSRTKFLDLMRERLLARMDELDGS
ncbi:RteC domain-containing protein [Pontibacter ummariensis]|uniref:RteC domain-containing protein n=1 Tax=Pontibacter ummariensis TaxID=1610492 RepID=UPI0015C5BD9E|nr:RteC domain-containing protein [Pontibacter ummariensis]